jgi:hypothetical protein
MQGKMQEANQRPLKARKQRLISRYGLQWRVQVRSVDQGANQNGDVACRVAGSRTNAVRSMR